jgi:hypothetical protein
MGDFAQVRSVFCTIVEFHAWRYFLAASIAFIFLTLGGQFFIPWRKVQRSNLASVRQMSREILWSLSTIIVFSLVGTCGGVGQLVEK